jgi:hypothetical protein
MFTCPNCRENSISIKNKYLAGWWKPITCPNCSRKLSAFPWLLMALDMVYVWNVMWFYGLYHFDLDHSPVYFVYMAVCWVILDVLNVQFMPLSIMKNSR